MTQEFGKLIKVHHWIEYVFSLAGDLFGYLVTHHLFVAEMIEIVSSFLCVA